MDDKYLRIVAALEELSRNGQGAEVRKELSKLVATKVPRSFRLPIANLSRRNNLPLLGIRLLNTIVRAEKVLDSPATSEEMSEYASLLLYIGAGKEAKEILTPLDTKKNPRVLLYQAFACFGRWEYSEALPLLKKYVEIEMDPYQQVVGQINLAAALVFLGHPTAKDLLAELREKTKSSHYLLLHGNSLELSALESLSNKKYRKTSIYLNEAAHVLKKSQSLNDFFVRKWRLILELHKDPSSAHSLHQVESIKQEAAKYQNWETIRDCDFHIAVETKNLQLFLKVYFGTPYASYRETMLGKIPKSWSVPSEYLLGDTQAGSPINIFDLKLGTDKTGKIKLKPGQILHRALVLLAEDFYHPKRIGTLHSELFPTEYFNPVSSPNRIHQVISRLRNWTDKRKIPLRVQEDNGYYWAKVDPGFGILIREDKTKIESVSPNLTLLQRLIEVGFSEFSAKQACHSLSISRSAFNRFALEAENQGLIERRGQSSATHYVIKPRKAA